MQANYNLLKQLRCLVLVPILGLASSAVIAGEEVINNGTGVDSAYEFSSHPFGTTSSLFDKPGVNSAYAFSSQPFGTTSSLFDKPGVDSAYEFSPHPFVTALSRLDHIVLAAMEEAKEESAPKSEQCVQFAADPDADLGEVLNAGCKPTLGQMSALMDNPLGNVAMLFTQFDYYLLENDANGVERNQYVYTGVFQFPKKLNDDWNLISRVIWTVPSVPISQDKLNAFGSGSFSPGTPGAPGSGTLIDAIGGRTTGFGDMYYVGLFAPSEAVDMDDMGLEGKLLWGAGFDISFPTATEDVLGSNKWSAGPSALGVYMGPTWKVGGLLMHYNDFAGDDFDSNGAPVADVSLTNLQYFVFYSLDDTTSIGASPNIIMDWEADSGDRLTVPIGIGYVKTVQFGPVPVRIGLEFHYSVIRPDNVGTEFGIRFYMIPAAPSAMFKWMG